MVGKKARIYRYLLIVFLIIVLWFMCKLIGCGNAVNRSSSNPVGSTAVIFAG